MAINLVYVNDEGCKLYLYVNDEGCKLYLYVNGNNIVMVFCHNVKNSYAKLLSTHPIFTLLNLFESK